MSFIWPEMLLVLLVVPVLIAAYILAQRRRQKYTVRYASLSLVKEALGRGPGIRRHIPPILFLIGVTVLIVALSRPQAAIITPSLQGTVILALDVSGSMQADDVKPTRLEAAKAAARDFVDKQPNSVRVGIVAFSDNAAIVQAPTNDRAATILAINRLMPQRGTAIGRGILTSIDSIFEDPTKPMPTPYIGDPLNAPPPTPTPTPMPRGTFAPGIVVLLSDGESNVGPAPLSIIDQAANRGVRVYTVGLGSPEGVVLKVQGRSVRVRLDEATLKKIADDTRADYFQASNESDLKSIYNNLSTSLVFETKQTELTAYVTASATIFFLLAGALSLMWFNRLP